MQDGPILLRRQVEWEPLPLKHHSSSLITVGMHKYAVYTVQVRGRDLGIRDNDGLA